MDCSNYLQKPQATKQIFQCKSSGYTLRCWSEKFLNNTGKCQYCFFPNRTRSYGLINEDGRQFCFRMEKRAVTEMVAPSLLDNVHGTKRFAVG